MNLYPIIVILMVFCGTKGTGFDSRSLKQYPTAMPNVNRDMVLGRWIYLAGRAACVWSAMNDFSDLEFMYTVDKKGIMATAFYIRYRGECSVFYVQQTFNPRSPAITSYTDKIGGLYTGQKVLVATDYKTFAVDWGCAQPAVDGSCKDPWVAVRTRKLKPCPVTLGMINRVLNHTWGMQLDDLFIKKNSNPCQPMQPPPPPPKHYMAPAKHYMPPPSPAKHYKKGK